MKTSTELKAKKNSSTKLYKVNKIKQIQVMTLESNIFIEIGALLSKSLSSVSSPSPAAAGSGAAQRLWRLLFFL